MESATDDASSEKTYKFEDDVPSAGNSSSNQQGLSTVKRTVSNDRRVPPRDMKRLKKRVKYLVTDVDEWGGRLVLVLENPQDKRDTGRYKLPIAYSNVECQVGDFVQLLSTGFSQSRNLVAQHVLIEDSKGVARQVPPVDENALKGEKRKRSSSNSNGSTKKRAMMVAPNQVNAGALGLPFLLPQVLTNALNNSVNGADTNAQSMPFNLYGLPPQQQQQIIQQATQQVLQHVQAQLAQLPSQGPVNLQKLLSSTAGQNNNNNTINPLLLSALTSMNANFVTTPQQHSTTGGDDLAKTLAQVTRNASSGSSSAAAVSPHPPAGSSSVKSSDQNSSNSSSAVTALQKIEALASLLGPRPDAVTSNSNSGSKSSSSPSANNPLAALGLAFRTAS